MVLWVRLLDQVVCTQAFIGAEPLEDLQTRLQFRVWEDMPKRLSHLRGRWDTETNSPFAGFELVCLAGIHARVSRDPSRLEMYVQKEIICTWELYCSEIQAR